MIRLPLAATAAAALLAGEAFAQHQGHHGHQGHGTHQEHHDHGAPAPPEATPPADPHAGHAAPAAPNAPSATSDPHAGHGSPPAAPHGHVTGPAPAGALTGADLPVGSAAPPPPARDHAADRVWTSGMDRSRRILAAEHGGARHLNGWLDRLEILPAGGDDAYAWEARLRYGGDVNRLVLKTEGEGEFGKGLEAAEIQALWSRAVTPYFDLQLGLRQDIEPHARTYAVIGVDGLSAYWVEVEAALFVSDRGMLQARLEGSWDARLTQRLILEPRAEVSLASDGDEDAGLGGGLQEAELGLRLRYEIRREFAPYVGVHYARSFGETADLARDHGNAVEETRAVFGLRAWF